MDPAYLVAALAGGLLAFAVRLPPLVGFLAAGFVLNALGYEKTDLLATIADVGVVLLLFTIGLKLNVRTLLRREVWGTATLHMIGSTALMVGLLTILKVTGIALLAGSGWEKLLMIGFALSFSSTVFAVKLLEERSETRSLYGRIAVGILIMQDIFAVIFLGISTGEPPSPFAVLLVGLIPLAPLLQRLLARIGHGELQTLFGVAMAMLLGYALFDWLGIKGDLGALVVGMLLAPHPAATTLSKSLFNLKELFLVGFFLSIGLTALPTVQTVVLALILVALIPVKSVLFMLIFHGFRLRHRTSTLATLSLSNFSEFGLIVVTVAATQGWVDDEWLVVLSLAVAVSFAVGAVVNARNEAVYRRLSRYLPERDATQLHPADRPIELDGARAVVLGMGRVGAGAYDQLARDYDCRVLGIDNNPDKVAELRAEGYDIVEGDADDSDFWDKLVLSDDVRLVLLAMPHHAGNLNALHELRDRDFAGTIAAVVLHADQIDRMRRHGADAVYHVYAEAGSALADSAARTAGLADRR
jgi:glutathione-regulated potassium-efflux system ancillary protein KefC